MRILTAIFLVCLQALSAPLPWVALQPRPQPLLNLYTVTCDATLSSATTTCTVQQPASGARTAQFVSASVYCSVAMEFTQYLNGTAATATAATIRKSGADAPTATAWSASNVGVGTPIGAEPNICPAGSTVPLPLSDIQLSGNGTGKNYSIKTSSITGRALIMIAWREYQ